MIVLRPLLADLALIKVIMFVVVVAIYAINHLLSGLKKGMSGQPPRTPGPTMRPPADQPRPADAATPPVRQDVNAELNEFLRRAAAKRQEAASRLPQTGPIRSEPAKPRKRKKSEAAAEVQPNQERLTARRALPRLETTTFDQRPDQLKPLERDEIGDRVRETFDRQLGHLGAAVETSSPMEPKGPAGEVSAGIAVELSALLTDAKSLRGAIILNEILPRPVHRW